MISWSYLWLTNFSGDQKFISTFDLLPKLTNFIETFYLLKKWLSISWSFFWPPEKITFNLLIFLLTSWKMLLLISWNSTSCWNMLKPVEHCFAAFNCQSDSLTEHSDLIWRKGLCKKNIIILLFHFTLIKVKIVKIIQIMNPLKL